MLQNSPMRQGYGQPLKRWGEKEPRAMQIRASHTWGWEKDPSSPVHNSPRTLRIEHSTHPKAARKISACTLRPPSPRASGKQRTSGGARGLPAASRTPAESSPSIPNRLPYSRASNGRATREGLQLSANGLPRRHPAPLLLRCPAEAKQPRRHVLDRREPIGSR